MSPQHVLAVRVLLTISIREKSAKAKFIGKITKTGNAGRLVPVKRRRLL